MNVFATVSLGLFLVVRGTVDPGAVAATAAHESASEKGFVHAIQMDLGKRFPKASDAERAGYVRYTEEDETGAISYANKRWRSADARHPSQLWYDRNGNLLGADFSVPKAGAAPPPTLWGVAPTRWHVMPDHVHYVLKPAQTGIMIFGRAVMTPRFLAAGGDGAHPSPATLVKLGLVKDPTEVVVIFRVPLVYDLTVWVKPNPDGAFADSNPNVQPSKPS